MKTEPTVRPAPKTGKQLYRSLRWQVSTLLLLSTLTAVALTALTILLATALAAGPTLEVIRQVGTINTVLDDVQNRVVRHGAVLDQEERKEIKAKLDLVDERLKEMGDLAADSRPEVRRYRALVERWLAREGDIDEAALNEAAVPLLAAHRRVQAALIYSAYGARPEWLDWLLPTIPGGLAWILLMSGLSVWRAYRMRGQLSQPLQVLANAASEMRAGTFRKQMPEVEGVTEVLEIRESMEAMREGLVSSISSLDERNEELSTILNNMTDGVLLVGLRGKLLEFNPSVDRLWTTAGSKGTRPREGLLLTEAFPRFPDDILTAPVSRTLEVIMDPSASPPVIFEISTNPIKGQEEASTSAGYVLVVTDVSAARELEKLKLHFLSMVTHELKTPLTSVLGYTKVMLMGKGGELSPKQREYIRIIDEQASQLRSMIQDMLDMTRLEVGNLSIEASPVRVVDLLESALSSHMAAAKVAGIEIGLVTGELQDQEVLGDSMRLNQVLGNLVGNALKFTPKGGRITLRGGAEGKQAWMSVEDTGRGIPQASIPHLFEKFYQVERGDTRKSGGAGLGLYICRELVRQMGGRIVVTSAKGTGSTFKVYLPLFSPLNKSD